jgi:hypothetical protein
MSVLEYTTSQERRAGCKYLRLFCRHIQICSIFTSSSHILLRKHYPYNICRKHFKQDRPSTSRTTTLEIFSWTLEEQPRNMNFEDDSLQASLAIHNGQTTAHRRSHSHCDLSPRSRQHSRRVHGRILRKSRLRRPHPTTKLSAHEMDISHSANDYFVPIRL